jgi:hypothetical protein
MCRWFAALAASVTLAGFFVGIQFSLCGFLTVLLLEADPIGCG